MATKKESAKTAAQSPVKRFRAVVERREGGEVCSIDIPFDVEKTFGARGRVPVRGGETVPVTMERDTEGRVITPPADFARALKSNKEARAVWDQLSYTHRREHARHIEESKKPETRARRIEKSIALLAAG